MGHPRNLRVARVCSRRDGHLLAVGLAVVVGGSEALFVLTIATVHQYPWHACHGSTIDTLTSLTSMCLTNVPWLPPDSLPVLFCFCFHRGIDALYGASYQIYPMSRGEQPRQVIRRSQYCPTRTRNRKKQMMCKLARKAPHI